jgi:AraC-like DNA-binding protein
MNSIISTKGVYKLLENDRCSTTPNGKKTIQFNNHVINGSIEYILLEAGLYMLNINVEVKEDCIITDSDDKEIERKYFLFSYLLSPYFNDVSEETTKRQSIIAPCLLTSYSNSGMKLSVKKNSIIQSTVFAFSEVWMEAQLFSEASQMESNLFNLFLSTRATPLTKSETLLLKNINEKAEGKNLLKTKIYVFNLILVSLENRNFNKKKTRVVQQINNDTLREVEKKILDHLYTSMPSIDEMAKEFFMSPSTLKRQFKRVFGSNVYEYYLSRKMQLAKNILEMEKIKVSEVAAQLHYENVSHFIKIFKKIHGFQPGKISKSKQNGMLPFFSDY